MLFKVLTSVAECLQKLVIMGTSVAMPGMPVIQFVVFYHDLLILHWYTSVLGVHGDMAKSSEDVLSVVQHVKNKKCEGTLYMMSERMAWMPATKQTFTVSHNYVDIKSIVKFCLTYENW